MGYRPLFICEALLENNMGCHCVMDPYQKQWNNIGLKNIKDSGYGDLVTFYEEYSDRVLSALYRDNQRVQFAYIDSTKVFDVLMVDVYFINKILDIGGVIVLDDCQFPGIKLLCRFLLKHPSFQLYNVHKPVKENDFKKRLSRVANLIPKKQKLFRNDLLETDTDLGINYHCIAFEKVNNDERTWKWHESF